MRKLLDRLKSRLLRLSRRDLLILGVLFIMCFVVVPELFARAGGGGGSRSRSGGGGGGDGDLIYLVIWIIMQIPFPYNVIIIALLAVAYYFYQKKAKQKTVFNKLPQEGNVKKARGYDNFLAANPGFNEGAFKEKVKSAFIKIQDAWQKQDISAVRRFISDGVYQRFNTQFKMMRLLDQQNVIDNLKVLDIRIDRVESDGRFDIVHVAIHASIVDRFVSKKFGGLNNGGAETFVEYWSFIKRRGVQAKDMYSTMNCPQCGAELPAEGGELARCQFCESIVNSGEYDWILSEITQADDYVSSSPRLMKSDNLNEKIRALVNENDDFSVQLVEDKASNGYLQVLTALTLKKPELMRRFVSDRAFERLKARIPGGEIVYNRLYLNDVSLIGVFDDDRQHTLAIAVKSSFQRVEIKDGRAHKLDQVVVSFTEVMLMSRDIGAGVPKGSLYAHSCPNCGGPVGDTVDIKCQSCGSELNSTAHEWIITDIMTRGEYEGYRSSNKSNMGYSVKGDELDSLYGVRDFAFNNVLIMIAADGVLDPGEQTFAERLAKKWGYNIERIQPIFEMARSGRLVLRMPDNPKERQKIYKLMEKAAMADGSIDPQEQQLLDLVKMKYL